MRYTTIPNFTGTTEQAAQIIASKIGGSVKDILQSITVHAWQLVWNTVAVIDTPQGLRYVAFDISSGTLCWTPPTSFPLRDKAAPQTTSCPAETFFS